MSAEVGRALFVITMITIALIMFFLLMQNVRRGNWLTSVALSLSANHLVLATVWILLQKGQPDIGRMTWQNVSYAAVLGDSFVLPAAVALVASGWKRHESKIAAWWKKPWWLLISFAAGLGSGTFYHFVMGGRADSTSSVAAERLHDAPLSWAHNFEVFPALLGTLLCATCPLLTIRGGRKWALWTIGLLLVALGGMSLLDMWRSALPEYHWWHYDTNWLNIDRFSWSHWRPSDLS